jgi:uncharacterized protein YaiI (UPF0178 family)
MTIYVDADACPVVRETVDAAKRRGVPVVLLCDTNHALSSDYAQVMVIGAGADAVDFALVNRAKSGDIVVTQDYGVAAMALSRGAHPIHQSGMWYTSGNIEGLLAERHIHKKIRKASARHHLKGPRKRTAQDDRRFSESLERLIQSLTGGESAD